VFAFGTDTDLNSSADVYALKSVVAFNHFVKTWAHHPRFREISGSLGIAKVFNHHIAALSTVSYLMRAGNSITLAQQSEHGRTADLYVLVGAEKINVEVKAPRAL
jgi:hypothetical protein